MTDDRPRFYIRRSEGTRGQQAVTLILDRFYCHKVVWRSLANQGLNGAKSADEVCERLNREYWHER